MRRLLLATSLLLLLLPAGAFAADNPRDLLVDACRDEKVDGTYSQRTYKRALDQLPADSDQYTACRDVINRARLAALNERTSSSSGSGSRTGGGGAGTGAGGSGGGSGGGTPRSRESGGASDRADRPISSAEKKQVQDAATSGSQPVRIGGELIQPGAVGNLSNSTRDLPAPVVAMIVALAVCVLAAVAAVGWSRVLARRRD